MATLGAQASAAPVVPLASVGSYADIDLTDDELGLWLTTSDGLVVARGPAPHFGDRPALLDGESVVELVPTPSGDGYWLFTDGGRVHVFGDAQDHGDVGHLELAGPVVAATATPTGDGYYMLGSDGGIFALGSALFHGSIPQVLAGGELAGPIAAMSATERGYLLVGSDGGTFAFGDAGFHGSVPGVLPGVQLASNIVGVVPGTAGYLMLGGDGGIFNFGQSRFHGSLAGFGAAGIVSVAVTDDLSGYLMLDAEGNVWPFGEARHIGVETTSGSDSTSVAFDQDDPVVVEVTLDATGTATLGYAGLGEPTVLDGPGVARLLVHAPEAEALDLTASGRWTVRVQPLSYATQWRNVDNTVAGTNPDVFRIDRGEPGVRAQFHTDEGHSITVTSRSVDGSTPRLLYDGTPPGGVDAVVLPLHDGPMILSVMPNAAWTLSLVPPALPRSVEIVGDSVGITLYINGPSSLDGVFSVRDSSIEGCGIVEQGAMMSGGRTRRDFSACVNFAQRWAADVAAHGPDMVLVVIGAWEVFDLFIDGATVSFGSEQHDAILRAGLMQMSAEFGNIDTAVALLEVPCQFPRPGGGLTPLPERGERWRTDHLNVLLREIAAEDDLLDDRMRFVTSPPALCDDPAVGDNPSFRWDGTHFGPPGGALVWDHLLDQLLRMP